MNEKFTLRNDPPEPKRAPIESSGKRRQRMLFSGLDCLPGQMDLFPTDGQDPEPEHTEPNHDDS